MSGAIAERELLLSPELTKVTVGVHVPIFVGPQWRCAVTVSGLQGTPPLYADGVDALQAVKLAIVMIEAWLHTRPECKEGRLRYPSGHRYRSDGHTFTRE